MKGYCPFKTLCNDKQCALWVEEDEQCAIRLAGKSLSELSSLAMTINKGDTPGDVEDDLPFC